LIWTKKAIMGTLAARKVSPMPSKAVRVIPCDSVAAFSS